MNLGVILSAGKGERLSSHFNYLPKSLLSLKSKTLIEQVLDRLLLMKVDQLAIVVGYRKEEIIRFLGDHYQGVPIEYIQNRLYDHHGTGYSVALCASLFKKAESAVVSEGDVLLPSFCYKQLAESPVSSMYIREGIDPYRSVVVLGKNEQISELYYDPRHQNLYDLLPPDCSILGESTQIWSLKGNFLKQYSDACWNLLERVDSLYSPSDSTTNLWPLNRALQVEGMKYLTIKKNMWVNLNFIEDYHLAHNQEWIV